MKKFYLFVGLWVALFSLNAQNVATFDDVMFSGSYWNGADGSGGFKSGSFHFPNSYNADWGSWSGFSVSAMKDTVTAGWSNQYSAITAGGANGSGKYAVVYLAGVLEVEFDDPQALSGFYVTNATYTYLSMKNGDDFTKKFGGINGTDPDYLKLWVSGTDIYGNETAPVEFFLADFTPEGSKNDVLVNTWKWFDLSSLGVVTGLKMWLESTDNGIWGMNTPAYFCIDNFNGTAPGTLEMVAEADFENLGLGAESFYNGSDGAGGFISGGFTFVNSYNADWYSWSGFAASTVTDNQTPGWANQYSAVPGTGALGTSAYAVAYVNGNSDINFQKTTLTGLYITNATYTYLAMKNGDDFSKKFGGTTGNDPDWLKVTIAGIAEAGDTTGIIDYYLADFRAENSKNDVLIDQWEWIDLTSLGEISTLRFSLSSSDNGMWGMNTPAYFCIDQLNHQDLPPVVANPVETVNENYYSSNVFYVSLDSVFTDPDNPDSEMIIKLENIDNPGLLAGSIVVKGKAGEHEKVMLALNIQPEKTGLANVVVSATSNGKTIYHSFKVMVTVPVSAPVFAETEWKVYPNPVQSRFYVELPTNARQIALFTSQGELIFQQNIFGESKVEVDQLVGKPSGIYFLKVLAGNEVLTQKIIRF